MNEIQVFAFDSNAVRAIVKDGEPWFVATDVAAVLGYRDSNRIARLLDDDEKGTHLMGTLGGEQEVSVISESGLYAAVLKSHRPEAKRFRKWVTAEVLPAIRKTGSYQDPRRMGDSARGPSIPAHAADRLVAASRTFNALLRAGRAARVPFPAAIQRAAQIAERETGIDLLDELSVDVADFTESPRTRDGGAAAAAAVQRFWGLLEARCFPGIDASQPMRSLQLYRFYGLWTQRAREEAVTMARFIGVLRASGVIGVRRKRFVRADGCIEGPTTFIYPMSVFEDAFATRDRHALGRCVQAAQAAIDAYAKTEVPHGAA